MRFCTTVLLLFCPLAASQLCNSTHDSFNLTCSTEPCVPGWLFDTELYGCVPVSLRNDSQLLDVLFMNETSCEEECIFEYDPFLNDEFVPFISLPNIRPPHLAECTFTPNASADCGERERSLRWYFDADRFNCYAFAACTDEDGGFEKLTDCFPCIPADGPVCINSTDFANPPDLNETPPLCDDDTCPAEYVCQMGAFFPSCCDKIEVEAVERAYSETCATGHSALTVDLGDYEQTVVGRSCDTLACSRDYECQSVGGMFAKCCKIIEETVI